jgi:hypothetical protein
MEAINMKKIIFILLLFTSFANATTYYVKASASGTGNGLSDATAWTFTQLKSATLNTGDIVNINRGDTFTGSFQNFNNAGVVFQAYGTGANPILSGLVTASGWTNLTGNIYYIPITVGTSGLLNMVTFDGNVQAMGRYPRTTYLTMSAANTSGNTYITGPTISFNPTGGEVVIRKARFILDRHTITSQSTGTLNFSTSTSYGNNNEYNPVVGYGYFVQNCQGALTNEGDWWYDKANNRLCMYFSDSPTSHVVQYSNIDYNVYNNSFQSTWINIDFVGANIEGYLINSVTGDVFNNCNWRLQGGDGVQATSATNTTFNNCTLTNCLNNGYNFLSSTNTVVYHGNVTNIGLISGAGTSGGGGQQGITIGGSATVQGVAVTGIGYNGIAVGGSNITVDSCVIKYFCSSKDDGGGIYTYNGNIYGVTTSSVNFHDNLIMHGVGALPGTNDGSNFGYANGIYLDNFTNGTTANKNAIYDMPWSGVYMNSPYNDNVTNNSIYQCAIDGIALTAGTVGKLRNLTITGNTVIAKANTSIALLALFYVTDTLSRFGTINSNTYGRPIDDNLTIQVAKNYIGGTIINYNLTGWKALSGFDASSSQSAIAITDTSTFKYNSNATGISSSVTLTSGYKEVTGTTHAAGTLTLSPYSQMVLLPFSVTTSLTHFLMNKASKKNYYYHGALIKF